MARGGHPEVGNAAIWPRGEASAVAFSPDGRLLVSGGKASEQDRATIHVRDAATGLIEEL
jgi:hypothetical protein